MVSENKERGRQSSNEDRYKDIKKKVNLVSNFVPYFFLPLNFPAPVLLLALNETDPAVE